MILKQAFLLNIMFCVGGELLTNEMYRLVDREYELDIQLAELINNVYRNRYPKLHFITILDLMRNGRVVSRLQLLFATKMLPVVHLRMEYSSNCLFWYCSYTPTDNEAVVTFLPNLNLLSHVQVVNKFRHWNHRSFYTFIYCYLEPGGNAYEEIVSLANILRKVIPTFFLIHVGNCFQDNGLLLTSKQSKCALMLTYNTFSQSYYIHSTMLIALPQASDIVRPSYTFTEPLNFHYYPLHVSTVEAESQPVYALKKTDGNYFYEGYLSQVFKTLKTSMNFTMKVVKIHGWKQFGSKLPNGSWTGLIGDVARKESDVGYSITGINSDRYEVVDFAEFYQVDACAVLVHKGTRIPAWKYFLTIYDVNSLLSIMGIYFTSVMASKMLNYITRSIPNAEPDSYLSSLTLFGILLQISVKKPRKLSQRILFFCWAYVSLVTASVYTGAIVSVLTIGRYQRDINSLEELSVSKVTLNGVGYYKLLLRDTSNSVLKSLHERYIVEGHHEDILKRIIQGQNVADVSAKSVLEFYSRKVQSCSTCTENFHIMEDSLGIQTSAIAFSKGSPFVTRASALIGRMKEAGLIYKWYRDELDEVELKNICSNECVKIKRISLEDLQSCFYALLLGFFLTVFAFLSERIVFCVTMKFDG